MQSGGTYLQAFNCQLAVDSDHQVIVAVGMRNQPPDVEHLEPMLERITASAGALPDMMTMDAGYWSEDNAKACADQGIDAYIATGRAARPAAPAETGTDQGLLEVCPNRPRRAAALTVSCAVTATAPWLPSPPPSLLLQAL